MAVSGVAFWLDIPSGMSDAELNCLRELAAGRVVLEMGAWQGASTVAMAQPTTRLCSVDWHQGDQHAGFAPTLGPFLSNLRRHNVEVVSEHGQVIDPDLRRLMNDWWEGGTDERTTHRGQSQRSTVCVHVGRFEDVIPSLGILYSLAFVDGSHGEAVCWRDLNLALPHLRDGGLLAVHDYGKFEGVTRAVNRLTAETPWRIERVVATLAVLRC